MATRMRLMSAVPAPTSLPFSAGWTITSTAQRFALNLQTTAMKTAAVSYNTTETASTSPENALHVQYISPPLTTQTVSGTVKGQIRTSASQAFTDANAQMRAYVIQPDNVTVRGVLIELNAAALTNEYAVSALTNRKFPVGWAGAGAAVSSVNAVAGDRLVLEIGSRFYNTTASTSSCTLVMGDPSVTDLPEDEVNQTASAAWIEFSHNFGFLPETGSSAHVNTDSASVYQPRSFLIGAASSVDMGDSANTYSSTVRLKGSYNTVPSIPELDAESTKSYINRVFDTVANTFVTWVSVFSPDPTGTYYPGPGIYGVDTSDYVLMGTL